MNAHDRATARQDFIRQHVPGCAPAFAPASADASFRSYWRVRAGAQSWIVMDAPPDKEDIAPWLDIATRLRTAGVHAPQVIANDSNNGFVLMEDLGTRTYLPELNDASADALYADALVALARMQTIDTHDLPHYDRARLIAEMELLPEWFLKRHLGFEPSCDEWDVIEAAFTFLVHAALEQPRVFVHRDYHSRNLMIVERDNPGIIAPGLLNPGIIDFQDAVAGPIAYDLVSLLRDCYIAWPVERVEAWVESFRGRAAPDVDAPTFRRWFDLVGLQRHIKVLGIFCRLWYRDGKAQYLRDLPLVWRYFTDVARQYPELVDFSTLLQRAVAGRDLTTPMVATNA